MGAAGVSCRSQFDEGCWRWSFENVYEREEEGRDERYNWIIQSPCNYTN